MLVDQGRSRKVDGTGRLLVVRSLNEQQCIQRQFAMNLAIVGAAPVVGMTQFRQIERHPVPSDMIQIARARMETLPAAVNHPSAKRQVKTGVIDPEPQRLGLSGQQWRLEPLVQPAASETPAFPEAVIESERLRIRPGHAARRVGFDEPDRSGNLHVAVKERLEGGQRKRLEATCQGLACDVIIRSCNQRDRDLPIGAAFDVRGGETVTASIPFVTKRRSPERIEAFLKVRIADGNGAVLHEDVETLRFLLTDALRLRMSPRERELRLVIENPSRSSFVGDAMINGARLPVKLDPTMAEIAVHVAMPSASSTICRLHRQVHA